MSTPRQATTALADFVMLLDPQKWEAAFSKTGHGGFFTPCEYLKKRAAAGVELCATEERSKL